MTVGMLWFDNSGKPLAQKVAEAAAYHLKKFSRVPDLCLVHPSMVEGSSLTVNGANGGIITVRPHRAVLPGHLWIGVEEMPTGERK